VVFFDEIDSIASIRGMSGDTSVTERVVSQLLTEMDGIETLYGVVVIAATNRADMIDPALLRPGRFDKTILVPMPDREGRKKILEISTKEIPIDKEASLAGSKNPDYVDLEKIADASDGLSGADVAAIANTAASIVIHEFLGKYPDPKEAEKQVNDAKVTMKHFEEALKKVKIQKDIKIAEKIAVQYYM
jgi:transitional endoplasmic reticulum ATPase